MRVSSWAFVSTVPLALSCALSGCSGGLCSASELGDALASAGPGDVVSVGACTIEGAFVVPDGVVLAGTSGSILRSVDGRPVVSSTTSTAVQIRDLRIEVTHGGVGIRGAGTGLLTVERTEVHVERGIGVGLDASSATLRSVEVSGPVDATNAASAPTTAAETGAYGIVGRSLADRTVTLRDVHVSGFAVAAATFGGGTIDWEGSEGPDIETTRGIGLALFGSAATLRSVEVVDVLSVPTITSVGLAVIGDGTLDASELWVHDGDGFGVFSEGAALHLTDCRVMDQELAGIRVQRGSIDATRLTASGNGGAGLLAVDASEVVVLDADLDAQRSVPLPSGITAVTVGDGVQVVRDPLSSDAPPLSLRLSDVRMTGNARTGLLVDAADGPVSSVALERVTVDAPPGANGAIVQRAAVPLDWDAMVVRSGGAVGDATFSGVLDPVGIMMPPGLVTPDF